MQRKLNEIRNSLQEINIYDRHTLEKFMLGKTIKVFDEKQNVVDKITVEEHLIPIEKEQVDMISKQGAFHVIGFNTFNGTEKAKNIRIINYCDFIEQKNNFSEILFNDFNIVLARIEQDLEDHVLDNSKTNVDEIKNFINNEILKHFNHCKTQLKSRIVLYGFARLALIDPVIFYIDTENMKKMSVLFNKSIMRIVERHKKYIDKSSFIYKEYKEEHKFILKREKKEKVKAKHESNISWEKIFKEKSTYKKFIKYVRKHIINAFIDYSFLFQKLKSYELIHNHTHFKYIDWLNESNLITEKDYEEFVKNAGFRSLDKSRSEQRENNFNNIFHT